LECQLCGQPDGLKHWVRECTDAELVEKRREADERIRAEFGRVLRRAGYMPFTQEFKDVVAEIKRIVLEEGNERVWCGLWTRSQMEALEEKARGLRAEERARLVMLFKEVGEITTESVARIWGARDKTLQERGLKARRQVNPITLRPLPEVGTRRNRRRIRERTGREQPIPNVSVAVRVGRKRKERPPPLPVPAITGRKKRKGAQTTMEDFFGMMRLSGREEQDKGDDTGRQDGRDGDEELNDVVIEIEENEMEIEAREEGGKIPGD
jgi:hypothetical protein